MIGAPDMAKSCKHFLFNFRSFHNIYISQIFHNIYTFQKRSLYFLTNQSVLEDSNQNINPLSDKGFSTYLAGLFKGWTHLDTKY
jgi:hypothetical protein